MVEQLCYMTVAYSLCARATNSALVRWRTWNGVVWWDMHEIRIVALFTNDEVDVVGGDAGACLK